MQLGWAVVRLLDCVSPPSIINDWLVQRKVQRTFLVNLK